MPIRLSISKKNLGASLDSSNISSLTFIPQSVRLMIRMQKPRKTLIFSFYEMQSSCIIFISVRIGMTDPALSIGLVLHNACRVGLFWSGFLFQECLAPPQAFIQPKAMEIFFVLFFILVLWYPAGITGQKWAISNCKMLGQSLLWNQKFRFITYPPDTLKFSASVWCHWNSIEWLMSNNLGAHIHSMAI